MLSSIDVPAALPVQAAGAALQAVLASATFSKNPRLSALLRYLCDQYFRGHPGPVKEYSIATDVFGRSPSFDQSTDAIVRVEMHRLRKKLKEYYAGEGTDQPVEIVIQSGRYLPEFVTRSPVETVARTVEIAEPTIPAASPEWAKPPLRVSASPTRRHLWIALGSLVIVLIAVSFLGLRRFDTFRLAATAGNEDHAAIPASAGSPGDAVRILCGSGTLHYRDREGNEWGGDAFFSGGTAVDAGMQSVYRTRDPLLFRNMRAGEFSYKIPLKPGVYQLQLYFADRNYTPGPAMEGGENVRTFNVVLNGSPILCNFDIISDAGPDTADIRVFKDVSPASDGFLHLDFAKRTDMPLINAIAIVPVPRRTMPPIRIVTQDNVLTDRSGVEWRPDNYWLGGRVIGRFGLVAGPDDPNLYARERYGHFSYAVPVPSGRYGVSLHFAETYWGPGEQGSGGLGSRIFNVYCNGKTLLNNFDMLKETGPRKQIVKTFHGLEPSAQGTLLFSFVPVNNYANISAIEVTDETRE